MSRVLVTRPVPEGGLDPLVSAGHEIVLASSLRGHHDGTPLDLR